MRSRRPTVGLVTKSTAPSSSARSVVAQPASVSDETITTGMGRAAHELLQERDAVHARHLDVERQYVGLERADLLARRRYGSGAVPTTSIAGSRAR